ncbi:hypothetical protein [Novosphingobium sp. B 225]|uniref:hypothetical protein n=1 Tax=Novosphingobium sp. B 225 TaxID=1961849 RepID=UPI000B4A672E|nr:hypothetical protein [Novosphingobium sp. B 225]
MKPASYPFALPHCGLAQEYALSFDVARERRVLVIPALFDEGHKLRRLCVEVMRRLDASGIDSMLPDLPGTGESEQELSAIALEDWASAMSAAANTFGATHVLAVRGGGLLLPEGLPGWHYGPVKGASQLRTLLRARTLAAREAGREESVDTLLTEAQERGIELAGYRLSAAMTAGLQAALPVPRMGVQVIEQDMLGGSPLWLRAEPDDDADQADALAAVIAMGIKA